MKKKLSINDIARELNISKTTVSFVLNGKAKEKRVSASLEEKILNFAKDKGFSFNSMAQGLSTGKTKIIALLVERISDYFFSQLAYHLENIAYEHGYKIMYSSTENSVEKAREFIRLFRGRQVDGFIIAPPAGLEEDIKQLTADGYPVVLFDRYFPEVRCSYVVLDNYFATHETITYLINRGDKNIVYVDIDSQQTQMLDRRNGYIDAITKAGLTPLIKTFPFESSNEVQVDGLLNFYKTIPKIDSIFFATNYLALQGLKSLNSNGLKIAKDVDVVVFDGHEVFDSLGLEISMVKQPVAEMSRQLINVLFDQINSQKAGSLVQRTELSPELILKHFRLQI